jgi:hypothetical protein
MDPDPREAPRERPPEGALKGGPDYSLAGPEALVYQANDALDRILGRG